MSLDPRIDDLFEEVKRLKKAIERLTYYVDAAIWRVSSDEERTAGIALREEMREILEPKVIRDTRDKILERSDRR